MYLSELLFELHCSIVALWFARWQAALRLLMQMPEAWCPLVGAGLVPWALPSSMLRSHFPVQGALSCSEAAVEQNVISYTWAWHLDSTFKSPNFFKDKQFVLALLTCLHGISVLKAANACLEAKAFVSGKALVNEMLLAAVLPVTGLNGVDDVQSILGCRFDRTLQIWYLFEYINA